MQSFIGSKRTDDLSGFHTHELMLLGHDDAHLYVREGGEYAKTNGTRGKEDQTGLYVWGASMVLAQWLSSTPALRSEVQGSTVCELGAGCGVPGLAAALAGGARNVLLTDLRESTIANLHHNAHINHGAADERGCKVEVRELDWAQQSLLEPVRVVLGADLVYEEETVPMLAPLVFRLLEPGGVFLHAYPFTMPSPMRTGVDEFADELTAMGLRLEMDCEAREALLVDPRRGAQAADSSGPGAHLAQQMKQRFWLQCFRKPRP